MQRNIESFFKPVSNSKKEQDLIQQTTVPKKRKARVISSDEDEVSEKSKIVITKQAKKSHTDDRSSQNVENLNKRPSLCKLKSSQESTDFKRVNPVTLFGGETKRVEIKKSWESKSQEIRKHEDNDIDRSLLNIDLLDSAKSLEKSSERPVQTKQQKKQSQNSPKKSLITEKRVKQSSTFDKTTKTISSLRARGEHTDLETSVLSDEERYERKRMAAILYQKYKNRSSCLNPGSKEVPKGKPDCLKGLTFLVTGVLESLERDAAFSIIKDYGGRMATVVGKKLNYLIVGEDAGPKKLAQAEELNIKILSEDGLFDLIRERSGDTVTNKPEPEMPSTSSKMKKTKIKEEPTVTVKEEKLNLSPIRAVQITSKKEMSYNEFTNSNGKYSIDEDILAWVDKYKPTTLKEIIGQQGAASNVIKLTNWLSKWYINHEGKQKLQKPNPWAKNDDGSFYKAALLSGPPGIGKTTTATLVSKELGFDAVEFNASDTRSKRLLKEQVSELLSNKSLFGYVNGQSQYMSKKHVLIMDEVDGMAGNEDRGGVQELIGLIKDTSVPIICMCNDRNHQKMRSLVNYCYDLRFSKPRMEQIKGRIMSICFKERIKIDSAKVEEIIAATNNDIRQSINHISLLSAGKELNLKASNDKVAQKDLKMGPWEVVRKVFSADEHKHMTINDKSDLFFHDYSLAPLFVQQNYLQVSPVGPKSEIMQKVAAAADALSVGDMIDKRIRSNSAWSLLPTQAFFSSVLPGDYMSGYFTGQINFPGWLGKYSRTNKRSRLAQELTNHTSLSTSGSKLAMRLDYAALLIDSIVRPLREQGMDGVKKALNVLKEYHLLREDIETLIELTTWPGKKSAMDEVDGRVKAALTRAYNKEVMPYSYSIQAGVKKRKIEEVAEDELIGLTNENNDAAVVSDEEDKDDLENDCLIKTKKKSGNVNSKISSKVLKRSSSKPKASFSSKSKK